MSLLESLLVNPRSHHHYLRLRSAIKANDLGPLLGDEYKSRKFADKAELLAAQSEIIDMIYGAMNMNRLTKLLKDIKDYAD